MEMEGGWVAQREEDGRVKGRYDQNALYICMKMSKNKKIF